MNTSRNLQVKVSLNRIQAQKLRQYRAQYGISMQDTIRRALDAFFKIEYNKDV